MASKKASKGSASSQGRKMSLKELEKYRHNPETELSLMVVAVDEQDKDAHLLDIYLQDLKQSMPCIKKILDEKDQIGWSALHFAVAMKKLGSVKILVMHGASVDIRDQLGFTPLFLATGRYEDPEIASYLITVGKACLSTCTETGVTALHGASVQGSAECVKLLLKHGADPHAVDHEGISALDVAKDDVTRRILYDAAKRKDKAADKQAVQCAQCGKGPESGLKRCGQCHVTMYCSRECQAKHWKEGGHRKSCAGFVIVPSNSDTLGQNGYTSLINLQHHPFKLSMRAARETPQKVEFLRGTKFIVKVQVPMSSGVPDDQNMILVYSQDRIAQGYISAKQPGYKKLQDMVQKHGWLGVKAFFWAELTDEKDGSFKVYHGKCAPFQQW